MDTENPTILVDGVTRNRLNSIGQPIDHTDSGLIKFWRWFGNSAAVDSLGRPLILFHGTSLEFDAFSKSSQRSVLNNKYQGDGFHFTPDARVAYKYSEAARNQCLNKERTFAAIDREMPPTIAALFKEVVNDGYEQAWERTTEEVKALIKAGDDAGIDLNTLLDIAEYVEGTNYNKGRASQDSGFELFNFFSGTHATLPDWVRKDATELGIEDALPRRIIYATYLSADNVMITNNQEKARSAQQKGFNGILYDGPDLVDGVPEWIVFEPTQIKSVDNYNLWDGNDARFRSPTKSELAARAKKASQLLDEVGQNEQKIRRHP